MSIFRLLRDDTWAFVAAVKSADKTIVMDKDRETNQSLPLSASAIAFRQVARAEKVEADAGAIYASSVRASIGDVIWADAALIGALRSMIRQIKIPYCLACGNYDVLVAHGCSPFCRTLADIHLVILSS